MARAQFRYVAINGWNHYTIAFLLHTQPIEVAIRRLNELGVLTVFVILDSLSKVSAA